MARKKLSPGHPNYRPPAIMEPNSGTIFLADKSIKDATFQDYSRKMTVIWKYLMDTGRPYNTFTLNDFSLFLLQLRTRLNTNKRATAEGYRCAILHFQKTRGLWCTPPEPPWADSPLARKVVSGYAYNGKSPFGTPTPRRGAMDASLLPQLLAVLETTKPHLIPAVELGYHAALRPHQLLTLTGGSYSNNFLTVPDKRANAANGRPFTTQKEIISPRAQVILHTIEAITPMGSPYFPGLSLQNFTKSFSEAAASLPHHPSISLSGPHTLRHGGMANLLNLLLTQDENISIDTICQKLQTSPGMLLHYTTPNEERIS